MYVGMNTLPDGRKQAAVLVDLNEPGADITLNCLAKGAQDAGHGVDADQLRKWASNIAAYTAPAPPNDPGEQRSEKTVEGE